VVGKSRTVISVPTTLPLVPKGFIHDLRKTKLCKQKKSTPISEGGGTRGRSGCLPVADKVENADYIKGIKQIFEKMNIYLSGSYLR